MLQNIRLKAHSVAACLAMVTGASACEPVAQESSQGPRPVPMRFTPSPGQKLSKHIEHTLSLTPRRLELSVEAGRETWNSPYGLALENLGPLRLSREVRVIDSYSGAGEAISTRFDREIVAARYLGGASDELPAYAVVQPSYCPWAGKNLSLEWLGMGGLDPRVRPMGTAKDAFMPASFDGLEFLAILPADASPGSRVHRIRPEALRSVLTPGAGLSILTPRMVEFDPSQAESSEDLGRGPEEETVASLCDSFVEAVYGDLVPHLAEAGSVSGDVFCFEDDPENADAQSRTLRYWVDVVFEYRSEPATGRAEGAEAKYGLGPMISASVSSTAMNWRLRGSMSLDWDASSGRYSGLFVQFLVTASDTHSMVLYPLGYETPITLSAEWEGLLRLRAYNRRGAGD